MARFIELRRHTSNDGDVLTPQGIADACRIGRTLTGVYAFVVTSGAQRTAQTAACMLACFGDEVPGGVRVDPRLRSEHEERWRAVAADTGSSDIEALRNAAPDFVDEEAARLGAALRDVLDGLGHGEMALVIGHTPTNEAAVYGLAATPIPPMEKGGGVVIVEDAGGYRIEPIR